MAEKLALPPTVTVSLSVMFPELAIALRLPPILELPSCTAEAFITVALPPVPFVFKLIAPVAAKLSKVISASAAEVVKLAIPPTAIVPLSVIFPISAVAVKSPPILELPRLTPPVGLVIVTWPADPVVLKLTAPVAFNSLRSIVASAVLVVKVISPPTVKLPLWLTLPLAAVASKLPPTLVVPRTILLSAVCPSFCNDRLPDVVIVCRVISPLVLSVKPAPVPRVIFTFPVPASIEVAGAIVIPAAPASRCASTTPLATVSLAVIVRLPLSVLILALMLMLRPACKVKSPPLPPGLLITMSLSKEIPLLACSTNAVPASRVSRKKSG